MSLADIVWWTMGAGFLAYVLTGGADFGGGFWDLVACGPRKDAQRELIASAIGPIWEANHVWLVFIIVCLFTAFPVAFAALSVALYIPLTWALIGIVLRGAGFVFRAYGLQSLAVQVHWGRAFAWASSLTPVFLGMSLAGLASGAIRMGSKTVTSGPLAGWTSGFALAVGLFALALFAALAAVYLTLEAEGELRDDFRNRAFATELACVVLGAIVLASARADAPIFYARFRNASWLWPLLVGNALVTAALVWALDRRDFRRARVFVVAQVSLIILGFGLAMNGDIVLDALSTRNAAAPPETLRALVWALALGGALLAPSLWYLFRVFKSGKSERPIGRRCPS